jgi:protein O-mannosyl-transferase
MSRKLKYDSKKYAGTATTQAHSMRNTERYFLAGILTLTIVIYFNSLSNDFMRNWDDNVYVLENSWIKDLSFENIKSIFTSFHLSGNYHPLTLLSYAVEYTFAGLNPVVYHSTNLVLHCFNIILVYLLIKRLSGKFEVAVIVALFFGIHPMHVESVAWIAERKDVLYSLFFLFSLICYTSYLQHAQDAGSAASGIKHILNHWYMLTLVFFLFSLFSKSAAAVLPLSLFLIDYYQHRKIDIRNILEKIPFFILSIIFGIIAIFSQKAAGAITPQASLGSFLDRILFVCYEISFYLIKLFLPTNLSACYPYPVKTDGWLPLPYYFAPFLVLAILAGMIVLWNRRRALVFGVLFFLVNLIMILQVIPVGGAIVADRYTYIPYLGIFLIIGQFYCGMSGKKTELQSVIKNSVAVILIGYTIFFSLTTYERTKQWKSTVILFNDVIEKQPMAGYAYFIRGSAMAQENNTMQAISDFCTALEFNPVAAYVYLHRGNSYSKIKKYQLALNDYNKAIELDSSLLDAYYNRGLTYFNLKNYRAAIWDEDKTISLKPDYVNAYLTLGVAQSKVGDYTSAIKSTVKALELDSTNAKAYDNLGSYYLEEGKFDSAKIMFETSIKFNSQYWDAHLGLAILALINGDTTRAMNSLSSARSYQPLLRGGMKGIEQLESQGWGWSEKKKGYLQKLFDTVR